jgi:O-6-methylguanine DNA methyltransferase
MKKAYAFPTDIGTCGIVQTSKGICQLLLPEKDDETLHAKLLAASGVATIDHTPKRHRAIQRLQKHLSGQPQDFSPLKLDWDDRSAFAQRAYRQLRKVAAGDVTSYGELAKKMGSPKGSRAVGAAMGRNPIPVIVPCHRVLGGNGDLGWFSAHGDISTKLRLLTMEGFPTERLHAPGLRHLRRCDERLAGEISRRPILPPTTNDGRDPFIALARAIVHQQVSTKAGASIFNKLIAQVGKRGALNPQWVLNAGSERLRGAGLSRQKASYLIDLSEKKVQREIPFSRLAMMDDERVVDALTTVKGIGRWSAQIFLLFHLGRLDVFPLDDLGVKKGFQSVYGLKDLPTAAQMSLQAEAWRPYRSIASRYLWRAADRNK